MAYKARILADSLNPAGVRLTTFEITFPRMVLAEFNTHRMLSRNAASSRAIPIQKMIERVRKDPVRPVWWGKNQKGMQAKAELTGWRRYAAELVWLQARWVAIAIAWILFKIGLHKQIANRILEPWMWITVIVSATEWENFFKLRCHEDAQPEIQKIARMMQALYGYNKPKPLKEGEWHNPMLLSTDDTELLDADFPEHPSIEIAPQLPDSALVGIGRCARVSYLTHDGKRDYDADIELARTLAENGHWSPFEHVAKAKSGMALRGNFRGFVQARKFFPGESGSDYKISLRSRIDAAAVAVGQS